MGSDLTPACCFQGSPSSPKNISTRSNSPSKTTFSTLKLKNHSQDLSTLPSLQLQSLNSRSQLVAKNISALTIDSITFLVNESDQIDQAQSKQNANSKKDNQLSSKIIGLDDFQLLNTIGKGAFGKVYMARLNRQINGGGRRKFAIKQISKNAIKKLRLSENIVFQKQIMHWSNSNFITRMFSAFRDATNYYLVMEWAEGGDLYGCIRPGQKRNLFKKAGEEAIRFVLGCIILGLEYMHSNHIIFGDLKPENLLLFEDGYIKLADFGLSKKTQADSQTHESNVKSGTKQYFSPEIVLRNMYGKESDLWALGVVAYQLVNYLLPFELDDIVDPKKFIKAVQRQEKQRKWGSQVVSAQLRELVNGLLQLNPSLRLGANGLSQIKEHRFFKDLDWQGLEAKRLISPLLPILSLNTQNQSPTVNILNQPNFINNDAIHNDDITVEAWSTQNSQLYS